MNRIFEVGYVLKLSDKDFVIKKIVGTGASSVTYLAEYNKTEHILKECNPLGIRMHRNEEGVLIPDTKLDEEKFFDCLSRFKSGIENQLLFRCTDDLKNVTSNIQDRYDANGTSYIDMTYFGGDTYDNVVDKTLYDIFRRMKALAQIVGHYHKLGYLNLDIKPQNIYTIPETPEMVMMFDFDSVVQQDDIDTLISSSYTDAWAAPEQKMQKYRNQICNATDFFAIGEIIFCKLFDRHSTEEDRYSFSQYEYETGNTLFENVNPRVFPMITELIHKTLSCSVKKRYQSADELIAKLDELIKLADPKKSYLVSSTVVPKAFFIGRDPEIADIHNGFQKSNIQFLSGIGGIGKSELAKNYAKIYVENGDYDTVLFTTYSGSWMMLINDDNSINITNFGRFPEEKESDYYHRKVRKLKELSDERTLFIIDNLNEDEFEGEAQKQWEDVLSLGGKLLITTRQREWSYPIQNIDIFTQRDNLIALFLNYCDVKTEAGLTAVQEIIDYVGGHTLTIELIACQTKAGFLTPEKMLAKLKEHGISKSGKEKVMSEKDSQQSRKTAFEHITSLFNIADLDEQEKYVLANMSLIPSDGIKAELFAEWCELEDYDVVNRLVANGWLNWLENIIKIHPVVAEVGLKLCTKSNPELCQVMLKNQTEYLQEYILKKCSNYDQTYQDVIFFNTLAENLLYSELQTDTVAEVLTSISGVICEFVYINQAIKYQKYVLDFSWNNHGKHSVYTETALNNLSILYADFGDFEQALRYSKMALSVKKRPLWFLKFDNAVSMATAFNSLATVYYHMGNFTKALEYAYKALIVQEKFLGEEDIVTAGTITNLGVIYQAMGNFKEAFRYTERALKIKRKILGEDNVSFAKSLSNLGTLYYDMGDFEKALQSTKKVLEIEKKYLGEDNASIATTFSNLSALYYEMKDYEQAIQCSQKSLEIRIELFGEDNAKLSTPLCNLGTLYSKLGDFERALQYMQQVLKIEKNAFGEMHPKIVTSLNNIAGIYDSMGEFEQALQIYKQALHKARTLSGTCPKLVSVCLSNIGYLYEKANDLKTAEKYYAQAYEVCRKTFGDNHPDTECVKWRWLNVNNG